MNDEGVGRQSGRSRQVGSRHRRPLACHLVGNCTQLTTKSQPTNLRHSGILVPSSSMRVEPDDFSAQTNQFHGISLAGSEWVCRRRAELRQTFLCQRSRQGCIIGHMPAFVYVHVQHRFGHMHIYSSYISCKSTFLFS